MRYIRVHATLAVLALVVAHPTCSWGAGLKPALYDIDGKQEICLQAAGTWYSPTLANWTGLWVVVGNETHIFGNYNSGQINDSIVVKGKSTGSWTEWSDDLTFKNIYDPITVSKAGDCA
jgi:hypothetical protein